MEPRSRPESDTDPILPGYEARVIPEGINSSRENPLKELVQLLAGALLVLTLSLVILVLIADYLLRFVPPEIENRWFDSDNVLVSAFQPAAPSSPAHEAAVQYLEGLVEELQDDDHGEFEFSVTLYPDTVANAFVLPGGHIVVTSALLASVESENGLAMVLAHEMAHQYQRHPLRTMGRGMVLMVALGVLFGGDAYAWLQQIFSQLAQPGLLAFSREQERDADQIAVELLIQQYGHASGANEFFLSLGEGEIDTAGFYSTHPATNDRIEFLRTYELHNGGDTLALSSVVSNYLGADRP